MSSNEFILQLIQVSLKDLGYDNVAQKLELEVKNRRLHEQRQFLTPQQATEMQMIEWFHNEIKSGHYDVVETFIENSLHDGAPNSKLDHHGLNDTSSKSNQDQPTEKPNLSNLLVDNDDKELTMSIMLYLIRRTYFFELLFARNDDINQDILVNYLKNRLLPIIDCFQNQLSLLLEKLPLEFDDYTTNDPTTNRVQLPLWHLFNRQTLSGLVRTQESKLLLGLVMDFPYSDQDLKLQVLNNKNYFFGITNNLNVNNLTNLDSILRENLINQFLIKIFCFADYFKCFKTDYDIPPNCIQEIINQACTYQKQQNPYYLPPRTKTEKLLRLNEDQEPYLPGKHLNGVNQYFKHHYFSSKMIFNLTNNTNEVWFSKFSPLGKFLVTGSGDGKLILYDVVNNFKVIKTLVSSAAMDSAAFVPPGTKPNADSKSIVYCCWDPNEEYLVSSSLDTIIRVWYVGKLLEKTKKKNPRSSKESSNDYKLMSCFTLGENVRSWTCEFLPNSVNHKGQFIVGSPDKILKLYDVEGNQLFDFHGNIYESNFTAETSQDVNMEVVEDEDDNNANGVDDDNDDEDDDEDGDGDGEDVDHEDSLIGFEDIDADQDGKKKIKTDEKKKVDRRLQEYFNRVVDLVISPNGRILVTIDRNNQLQFFNIAREFTQSTKTTRIASINLKTKVTSCSISKNGKYLLLNAAPEEIQVWDISGFGDGDDETNFELPLLYRKFYAHNHASSIIRSSFGYLVQETNEEELILSGSHDGFVYVWKLHTGQIITRIKAHDGTCNMVDWNLMGSRPTKKNSRDYGKLWCSVGDDKNVKIWGPSDWE